MVSTAEWRGWSEESVNLKTEQWKFSSLKTENRRTGDRGREGRDTSGTCGTLTKYLTCMSLESQKGGRKRMGLEKDSEKEHEEMNNTIKSAPSVLCFPYFTHPSDLESGFQNCGKTTFAP